MHTVMTELFSASFECIHWWSYSNTIHSLCRKQIVNITIRNNTWNCLSYADLISLRGQHTLQVLSRHETLCFWMKFSWYRMRKIHGSTLRQATFMPKCTKNHFFTYFLNFFVIYEFFFSITTNLILLFKIL